MTKSLIVAVTTMLVISGCTSLGHENRTEPQIEKKIAGKFDRVYFTGSGELAIATELLLASQGIEVFYSPVIMDKGDSKSKQEQIRYAVTATSVDHDMCVPEGSRQMHFHITVVDVFENNRIFALSGDYGCKNTITARFGKWISSNKLR